MFSVHPLSTNSQAVDYIETKNKGEVMEPNNFLYNSNHGPINIIGDQQFSDFITSEGFKGNGTDDNPYIIDKLTIDARGEKSGILISDLYYSHFIISNCTIFNTTRVMSDPDINFYYGDIFLYNINRRGVIINNNRCNWITVIGVNPFEDCYSYITNNSGPVNGSCKIQLYATFNLLVQDNNFSGGGATSSGYGRIVFKNNIFSDVSEGLKLINTRGSDIRNNIFRNNSIAGLHINNTDKVKMHGNSFINSSLYITADKDDQYYKRCFTTHEIDESNTINGKKIYYYNERNENFSVPSDAGCVMLFWSSNIILKKLNLSGIGTGISMISASQVEIINCSFFENNRYGIETIKSYNINIINCTLSGNQIGISADEVINLKISRCLIKDSNKSAVIIKGYSVQNQLYHNIFMDNNKNDTSQCTDVSGQLTAWNHVDGYGNYWSDHKEPDNNMDGIVDNPYNITGGVRQDKFPLVSYPDTEILPPDDLKAEGYDSMVKLSWSDPYTDRRPMVSSINIYRKTYGEENFTLIKKVLPELKWYNDTSVLNGEKYIYYLTEENILFESEYSNTATARPEGLPEPPCDVKISCTNDSIRINWSTPHNDGGYPILGYSIYRNLSNDSFRLLVYLPSWNLSFLDKEIDAGYTYLYYITCSSQLGESSSSEIISIKPVDVPEPPISDLVTSGDGYVRISWFPPEFDRGKPILGYRIYRRNVSMNTQYNMIQEMLPQGSYYNDTAVQNDKLYSYLITCFNIIGESFYSKELTGHPLAPIRELGIPTNLSGILRNDYVRLKWISPIHHSSQYINGYNIYRSSSGSEPSLIDFSSLTTYDDYSITRNINYTYYVSALYFSGESDLSQPFSILVPEVGDIELLSPPGVIWLSQNSNGVIINWSIPEDQRSETILHYNVFRGLSNEDLIFFRSTSKTNVTDFQVKNGITYYYAVSAVYLIGESQRGEVQSIFFDQGPTPNRFYSVEDARYSINKEGVTLKWNLTDGYEKREPMSVVIRKIFDQESENSIFFLKANSIEYLDTDVEPGESYNYAITINYMNGSSDVVWIYNVIIPYETKENNNDSSYNRFNIVAFIIISMMIIGFLLIIKKSRYKRDHKVFEE